MSTAGTVGHADPRTPRWMWAVAGIVLGLLGLAIVGAGGTLLWAQTQRDADGFFSTEPQFLHSEGVAVTGGELGPELDAGPGGVGGWVGDVDAVQVRVTSAVGDPIFVGIGPRESVASYLRGAAHDEIVRIGGEGRVAETRPVDGEFAVPPPGQQWFWVAAAEGTYTQTIRWPVQDGEYSLVVMNADGQRSVSVEAVAAAAVERLGPFGVLGLGVGALVFGGAVIVGLTSLTGQPLVRPAKRPPEAADWAYPVRVEARLDEPLSRWLWLVKWLLLIPHWVALAVLWVAMPFITVVAGVAIIATGRYPRPLFDVAVGVLRWTWRVLHYGYGALATDRYPPFTLAPTPGDPAALDVAYPPWLSRGLVLFKWALALPHLLVVAVLVGFWGVGDGVVPGGLIGLLTLVAGVVLTVRGRYPRDLFDLIVGADRWALRVAAYLALLTDEYPPFRLDTGGREPEQTVARRPAPISGTG
jgi:hypothetical protein